MLGSKCTSNERTFGEGDGEKEEEQGERERLLPNLWMGGGLVRVAMGGEEEEEEEEEGRESLNCLEIVL